MSDKCCDHRKVPSLSANLFYRQRILNHTIAERVVGLDSIRFTDD